MQDAEVELRGRIMALEALILALLLEMGRAGPQDMAILRGLPAKVEDTLRSGHARATPGEAEAAAAYAVASFEDLTVKFLSNIPHRMSKTGQH